MYIWGGMKSQQHKNINKSESIVGIHKYHSYSKYEYKNQLISTNFSSFIK